MEDPEYHELPRQDQASASSNKTKLWRLLAAIFLILLLLGSIVFLVWPRTPEIEVVDVDFKGMKLNTTGGVELNINLDLQIGVRNPNFLGVNYDRVLVLILYHGSELGQVSSSGGRIPARTSVNLTSNLKLESLEIVMNAAELISDASREAVPVSAEANLIGNVNILMLNPRVKVTVLCDLVLDPSNSTILRKDCDNRVQSSSINQAADPLFPLFLGAQKQSVWFWVMIALAVVLGLLVLIGLVWILWPKTPEITVESLEIPGVSTSSKFPDDSYIPEVVLDITLGINLRIRNKNVVGVSYDKITIYVYYYGYELCKGELDGGEIPARDSVTVNTTLSLRGAEITYNSAQLVSDVAKRELPLNTLIEFSGNVGIWRLKPPIKAAVAYDLLVDPVSQEILQQDYHLQSNESGK